MMQDNYKRIFVSTVSPGILASNLRRTWHLRNSMMATPNEWVLEVPASDKQAADDYVTEFNTEE